MNKIRLLQIKGLLYLFPFLLLNAPFILLAFTFDWLEDVMCVCRIHSERWMDWAGNAISPPSWWPSRKIALQIAAERHRMREEAKAKLKEQLANRARKIETPSSGREARARD